MEQFAGNLGEPEEEEPSYTQTRAIFDGNLGKNTSRFNRCVPSCISKRRCKEEITQWQLNRSRFRYILIGARDCIQVRE